MRILMLSWEYPPLVYGGLARAVHALSEELVAQGHEVVVVTQASEGASVTRTDPGVRVIRVTPDPPRVPMSDLLAWTQALEHAMTRAALELCRSWRPDVIHAHDWLVAHAAVTLSTATRTTLVTTIHATEAGRWLGWLSGDLSAAIHSIEGWLTAQSDRVLVCSEPMRAEVNWLFGIPVDRVDVVRNGIDPEVWRVSTARRQRARRRWSPDGPLVVYTGRLEYEKGVSLLLDALPLLKRRSPGLKVVIAGRGSQQPVLAAQARELRLGRTAGFAGWLDDFELSALVAAADCVVVPSRYEPFGLVALEAAAVGTPVVASKLGGLTEIVREGETGLLVDFADRSSVARGITTMLSQPVLRSTLGRQARDVVRRDFRWADVAVETLASYERAIEHHRQPHPASVPMELRKGNQFSGRYD